MCIAFDLERYSRGTDAAQIEKQRAMSGLVREAAERGALERAQWITQEQGDGELALLPPGIDEAHVITSLHREFREGLHRYNRHANAGARLRMRLAVHEGQTYIAHNGFAGDAINTVCRLRDCHEAKDALSGTDSDLIIIASDRIYYDVIRGCDALELPASGFTETTVDMPDKGFRATAFIFSGQGAPPPGSDDKPSAEQRAPSARPVASAGGATINIGPHAELRDVAENITHNHGGKS
jgi:hypothetical protein